MNKYEIRIQNTISYHQFHNVISLSFNVFRKFVDNTCVSVNVEMLIRFCISENKSMLLWLLKEMHNEFHNPIKRTF